MRPLSLKSRALQWLAQREHSPTELRDKLLRAARSAQQRMPSEGCTAMALATEHGIQPAKAASASPEVEVDTLLAWLSEHGYLSAQRFVDSRVRARQSRYGQLRIARELGQHGLQLDAATRQALEATELERAARIWHQKFGGPAADAGERLRQMRFLAGRGFSSDVIRRVLRGEWVDLTL